MGKRNGHNYEPVDFNTGVYLDAEVDGNGNATYLMTIEGRSRSLNRREYEAMMNILYYERKREREYIIKLLEDKYNYLIDTYGIAIVKDQLDLLLELIELINGENK